MSGEVTVTPGKRFGDDEALLALADLNDLGSPIMRLNEHSIGTAELIYQDVFDIIEEASLGIQTDYIFTEDLLADHANTPIVVNVPEARAGDPVTVTPFITGGLDSKITFWANVVVDGQVRLQFSALVDDTLLPAGTLVTIIVFTPLRFLPGEGAALGPIVLPDQTGYVTVNNGYDWLDDDAITTPKLDQSCVITASVPGASVGRRELDPDAIARIVAATRGGTPFSGQIATPASISPGGAVAYPVSLGISIPLGTIPVISSPQATFPLKWEGYIDPVNVLNVVARNMDSVTRVLAKGTRFQGRLL